MNALAKWNQPHWNQLNQIEDSRHTLQSLFSRLYADRPEATVRMPKWIAEMQRNHSRLEFIVIVQEKKQWIASD